MSSIPSSDRLDPASPYGVVAVGSVRCFHTSLRDEADDSDSQSTAREDGDIYDGPAADLSALSLPMQLMAGGVSALNKRSASPSTPTSSGYSGREKQPDRCTSIAQTTDESSIVAKYTSVATSYNSARSSDITVIIRGEKIRAHRIKLDECPFFERMLSRTAQDAAVVNLDTSEASPTVVKGFLCFLYRGQYDVDEIDDVPAPEWDAISLHAEVYVLACKYAMVELAQVAANRLTSWTRPLSDLTELFHTLHVLWTSDFEDRHELRQFFVGYCLPVVRTLMQEAWFKELMRRTELGADIAIALAAREKGERRDFIRCACNQLFDRRGKIRCSDCKTPKKKKKKKGKKTRRITSWVETWMRV
nr:hypothetical protein B0A51_00419 [Rachicladosporium sp. CCFEE 5018]